MTFAEYNTIFFDCDGVILNSNTIKSQAFYDVTLKFGKEHAQKLLDYHIKLGGVSRYKKFEYFISNVLKQDYSQDLYESLLEAYATEVKEKLFKCEVTPNLEKLREFNSNAKWLVASGGKESELQEVFEFKKINQHFDAGIFGSPTKKDDIVKRELQNQDLKAPFLFIGDSYYDFEVAQKYKMDFVFASRWSEWKGYQEFQVKFTKTVDIVSDLINEL